MSARILADFLLDDVIPMRFIAFREWLSTNCNMPMAPFIAEMKKWLMRSSNPEDRADIYKKLDAVPRELGGDDPWGYHIVETSDKYLKERYYNRSQYDAKKMRHSFLAKWEKFKDVFFKDPDLAVLYKDVVKCEYRCPSDEQCQHPDRPFKVGLNFCPAMVNAGDCPREKRWCICSQAHNCTNLGCLHRERHPLHLVAEHPGICSANATNCYEVKPLLGGTQAFVRVDAKHPMETEISPPCTTPPGVMAKDEFQAMQNRVLGIKTEMPRRSSSFNGYHEAQAIEDEIAVLMKRYPIAPNKKEWLKFARTVTSGMNIIYDSILADTE